MDLENLVRSVSDHAPMLLQYSRSSEQLIKPFRFFNFWLKEESCMEVIRQNWKTDIEGNPFVMFHQKLKRTKVALTERSKQTFGNMFQEIATLEDVIKVREKQFEAESIGINRAKLSQSQIELAIRLRKEEDFWRQEARFEWFKDGERNTRFFYVVVKKRRSRLKIQRIQNEEGSWLDNQDEIAEAATTFFQKQFESRRMLKTSQCWIFYPR
ncbi:uncharacterized protein LOC107868645 [Capsicum annuum]|uniref:uncharacterized protein LOC107868645 n=1 Tax=Capsicum annuum TaxID=4072 RepID=UPI001FB0948E|nr:uncharacterized protein LOC107868645 [Capsicum annuum]